MRTPAAYLFAILVGAMIWFFFQFFKLEGTDALRVVPKGEAELNKTVSTDENKWIFKFPNLMSGFRKKAESNTSANRTVEPIRFEMVPRKSANSIRIASFYLHYFGAKASDREHALSIVAQIVRQFDIVALQGLSPQGGTAAVADLADRAGPDFNFFVGIPAAVKHQDVQFAYVFNTNTIIADRSIGLYTLGDPDDLLRREPLIGWFRAKEAPANEAFTFTLVNINTDKNHVQQELNSLDNVIAEVRADGREEDDVIMLGSFQSGQNQLFELGRVPGLVTTIRIPTNLKRTGQTENIVFQDPETDEFVHRTGVVDFLRAYNLSLEEAREVSNYLPVWAEFSIFEGGQRRRVTSASTSTSLN